MAVTYNTIEGTNAGTDKAQFRGVITGLITEIDTSVPAGMILSNALLQLPAYLSPYPDPAYPALLTGRFVERAGQGNSVLKFTLRYELPGSGIPAGTFILERRRSVSQVTTNLHPIDKRPLEFQWVNPNDPADKHEPANAELQFLAPQKSIVATGFYHGQPPAAIDTAFCKVNDATWQNLPAGYWLFLGADDSTQDQGNNYSIRLEFLSRVTEDWSSFAVFRHPRTGATLKIKAADAAELKNHAYVYGQATKNGLLKAGLYDTANFNSIFGF